MAEEITKTYRRSYSPDIIEESSGSAVAIVAIVVILLIAFVLGILYWNNVYPFKMVETNTVVKEVPMPTQKEVVTTSTNTKETNTIIQPQPSQQPAQPQQDQPNPLSSSGQSSGTY